MCGMKRRLQDVTKLYTPYTIDSLLTLRAEDLLFYRSLATLVPVFLTRCEKDDSQEMFEF